ncbi:MAG: carbamoyltransferase C-terminal domain-containing protein [Acidobacteriota bacterium]
MTATPHSAPPRPVLLGLNSGLHKHDAAAAVVDAVDGQLLAMVEQERLSRSKRAWGESASEAAALALELADSPPDAVKGIAFGWDEAAYHRSIGQDWDRNAFLAQNLPEALLSRLHSGADLDIDFIPHHLAHAAGALALAGFDNAAWLVADGRGERQGTSWGSARRGQLEVAGEVDLSRSLGVFYALAAEWAGLGYDGAGRLMGLAGLGGNQALSSNPDSRLAQPGLSQPRLPQPIPLELGRPDGLRPYRFPGLGPPTRDRHRRFYHAQRAHLWRRFAEAFPHQPAAAADPHQPVDALPWASFAAAVQQRLEEVLLHLARRTLDAAESSASVTSASSSQPHRLVFAGGVALNCSANGRILQELFPDRPQDFFVPPAAHDGGVAHGAAAALWRRRNPEAPAPPPLRHAAYGPDSSEAAIDRALAQAGLQPVATGDAALTQAAQLLASGKIVARFAGPAEIGPRALGHRSLLADPRRRSSADRLNTLKHRDPWRPVAPSVLAEAWSELFDSPPSPLTAFMLLAVPVPLRSRPKIPACVHVDGSARPQLVEADALPDYHRLIQLFAQLTGVPALCNTSLNGPGEPILHRPEQAVSSLLEHPDLDALLLGDRLVLQPHRNDRNRAGEVNSRSEEAFEDLGELMRQIETRRSP